MKKKNHLRFTRRKDPIPASHTKVFTDEEARILEKDFIEAYSGNSKSTLKILLIMYRRYPLQLLLSVLFYVIATLPHITIPIVTANLINVVVDVAEGKTFDYLTPIIINISVLVVLLLLNIPTNMDKSQPAKRCNEKSRSRTERRSCTQASAALDFIP